MSNEDDRYVTHFNAERVRHAETVVDTALGAVCLLASAGAFSIGKPFPAVLLFGGAIWFVFSLARRAGIWPR